MKVVHIIGGLPTGGAERMLVKLIKQTKKNINHVVISLKDQGEQGQYLIEMGIPLYEMNIGNPIDGATKFFKLKDIVKKERPSVIQGWMYHGNFLAGFLGKKLHVPSVYNVRHSLHNIKHEAKSIQAFIRLNSFYSKHASSIVYNSSVSKKQHEEFGFFKKRSTVIPNGFDIEEYKFDKNKATKIRKELGIKEKDFLFTQIGRNHEMKNHSGFIKAGIEALKTSGEKDLYFLIVGNGVDTDTDLKDLIKKTDYSNHFFLWGQRTDISSIWNAANCGVLSSIWGEGFPNVVGEAMASETPCIVSDVGDSAFIVDEFGIVVPPNDHHEMSKAMVEMAEISSKELLIIKQQARKRIVDNFSIESISDQYLQLYKSILK